ncbi:MAG: hypothetical protein WCT04_04150 [Planctomycetota bacterium]
MIQTFRILVVFMLTALLLTPLYAAETQADYRVVPVSAEIALEYKLDTAFYKKCAMAQNILVATSAKVSDFALLEAAYQFDKVMSAMKPEIAQRVRDKKVLCVLVGHTEQVSEMPQFPSKKTGKELDYENWRNRGFLTSLEGRRVALFSEEDVLEYEGGMQTESILIHEFGHVVDSAGFDKDLKDRLTAVFKNAKEKGLYNDGLAAQRFRRVKSETPVSLLDALVKSFASESPAFLKKCIDGGDILVNGKPVKSTVEVTEKDKVLIVFGGPKQCYAAVNRAEFWAEGFQDWFDTNRTMDHDHNHIHTRDQLKTYDTELAKLCVEVLGDSEWRFVSPRLRAGTGHLKGYDPATAPKVEKQDHIDAAAQAYYDTYWKDFWKRLHEKYPEAEAKVQ